MCDTECHRISVDRNHQRTAENETEFELFSDRYQRRFSNYQLVDRLRFQPGPDTPVLNWNHMKDLLLSTDLSRAQELDWIDQGELRFLDGEGISGQEVAFQSFPRTGNSMMRKFLETATGIYTSSDMSLDITIMQQVAGLQGEELADTNLTWIKKTHWPHPMTWREKFHAQKMLVVVRNPIDVFPSVAGLINTCSHSMVPQKPYNELDFWGKFLAVSSRHLDGNFQEVKKLSETIPTFYVRFEDMRTDPATVLCEVFRFLFEVESIEGTVLEKRILEKCCSKNQPKAVYKLKSNSASLSRNAHLYNDE